MSEVLPFNCFPKVEANNPFLPEGTMYMTESIAEVFKDHERRICELFGIDREAQPVRQHEKIMAEIDRFAEELCRVKGCTN